MKSTTRLHGTPRGHLESEPPGHASPVHAFLPSSRTWLTRLSTARQDLYVRKSTPGMFLSHMPRGVV